MSLADTLRSLHRSCNPPCLVSVCSKEGCDLPIDEPSRFVCVDTDKCAAFPRQQKHPDYVILDSVQPCWIVVEMKGRTTRPNQSVEQLRKAADVIANDPRFALNVRRLFPLVLHQGIHRQDLLRFQKERIAFRGKAFAIYVRHCGTPLIQILQGDPNARPAR